MINPGEIPQIEGDIEAVAAAATRLASAGSDFSTTGADVDATWQGLSGVYDAPESALLLSATAPVRSTAAAVSSQVARVSAALATYADAVRPLKAELERLRSEASAFVAEVSGDDDWDKDGGKVDQHNGLLKSVNAAVAAWMDAQRRCANSINTVYGGTQYVADNGDENHAANEFGFSQDQLDGATASDDGVPWGTPEEQDVPWYADAWNAAWSFGEGVVVDGLWGALTGLGDMVGLGGWDAFTESWGALGELAVALAFTGPGPLQALAMPLEMAGVIPSADERLETLKAAGKSMVAWDTWEDDPARALGATLTNVVTAVVGTKGAGAALRTGTVARVTGNLAARFPRVAELAGRVAASTAEIRFALRTVDVPDVDVRVRLAGDAPDLHVPPRVVDHPGSPARAVDAPDAHVPAGAVDARDAHVPAGAVDARDAHVPAGAVDARDAHVPAGAVDSQDAPAAVDAPDTPVAVDGPDPRVPAGAVDGPDADVPARVADADAPKDPAPVGRDAPVTDPARVVDDAGGDVPGREVDAPGRAAEPRIDAPLNDASLAKTDPEVVAQVTQIRHDLAPILQNAVDDAWDAAIQRCITEGKELTPQRLGSYAHKALSDWINDHGGRVIDPGSGYGIRAELSYSGPNGRPAEFGTRGSVRPDIVLERQRVNPLSGKQTPEVVHVYDLKTGRAGISSRWADKVSNWLRPLDKPEELRPSARP